MYLINLNLILFIGGESKNEVATVGGLYLRMQLQRQRWKEAMVGEGNRVVIAAEVQDCGDEIGIQGKLYLLLQLQRQLWK